MYYNCGARDNLGQRVKTKKQLREELASHPEQIFFDGTALVQAVPGYRGSEVPVGVTLSVVLPDPYHDRRSYASVSRRPDGSMKVS